MSVEDEIIGADFSEHNIPQQHPQILDILRGDGKNTSQGFRLHKDENINKKIDGIYKTYLASDRSKAMTHDNSAFQHDESI